MPDIRIHREHQLGLAKARKIAWQWAEDVEKKFIRATKKGQLDRRLDRDAITDAVDTGVLTEAEAATLRLADQATDRVIRVDDFDPDELGSRQVRRPVPIIDFSAEQDSAAE